jgi:hypothetical protein
MLLYHERWTARPSWQALSLPERLDYLDRIGPALRALTDAGATLLGAALTESARLDRAGSHYQATWSMTGPAQVRQLHQALRAAGWHDYFVLGGDGADAGSSSAGPRAARSAEPPEGPSPSRNGRRA